MKISTVCVLAAMSIFLLGNSDRISESPQCTGWPFLKFSVKKPDGTTFSNADLKNKIVFATFWKESSPTCVNEIPAFNEMYERLKDSSNFIFILFTPDDDSTIKKMMSSKNIRYNFFHMKYKQCNRIMDFLPVLSLTGTEKLLFIVPG